MKKVIYGQHTRTGKYEKKDKIYDVWKNRKEGWKIDESKVKWSVIMNKVKQGGHKKMKKIYGEKSMKCIRTGKESDRVKGKVWWRVSVGKKVKYIEGKLR